MMVIASPDHSFDASFTFGVWVRGSPTPGTSAIVADATGPGIDSSNPAAGRIVRATGKNDALPVTDLTGGMRLQYIARGGTSLVIQPWFYEDNIAAWSKFAGTSTITIATANIAALNIRTMMSSKWYVQIVTVTGTVTEFGYNLF